MNNTILIIVYYATLSFIFVNVVSAFSGKPLLNKYFSYCALISSGSSVVFTFLVSGHLPIYNSFTTVQEIVFILIVLGVINQRNLGANKRNNILFWCVALVFQSYIIAGEMMPGNNYYMYDNLFVVMFFQFRLTAVAVFLFVACLYLMAIIGGMHKDSEDHTLHLARNYTLVGAVIYLAGEFCGSYWLYLWDGESWHWSKGFFLASVMFLLSMIGSHIPIRFLRRKNSRAILSLIPVLIIILIYLI